MELDQDVQSLSVVPSSAKRYTYTPLKGSDSIRILILQPGLPGDPLSGELQHVPLGEAEDPPNTFNENLSSEGDDALSEYDTHGYEAISYVWGEPVFTRSMQFPGGAIAITPSLEEVLLRFRLHDRPRRLWVDGVCIDQGNDTERGHQVKLMGRVYATAVRVLIWLGTDEYNRAQRAFAELRETRDKRRLYAPFAVLSESWFDRLWIVQEYLLSRSALLVWGDDAMDVGLLVDAIPACREENETDKAQDFLPTWLELKDSPSLTFLEAINATCSQRCSDQRDHVYAILGLRYAHDSYSAKVVRSIEPDYTKPARRVFLEAAGFCVQYGELETLLGQVKNKPMPNDPSWLPDWTTHYWATSWPTEVAADRLDTSLHALPRVELETGCLLVHAHLADVVTFTSLNLSASGSHDRDEFWSNHVSSSKDSLSSSDYATYEKLFLQALLGTRFDATAALDWVKISLALEWESVGDWERTHYPEHVSVRMLDSLSKSASSGVPRAEDLEFGESKKHSCRTLLKTQKGHIGTCSEEMSSGDIIAYLSTVKEPVILRYKEGRYTFVGCAFIPAMPQNPGFFDVELEIY